MNDRRPRLKRLRQRMKHLLQQPASSNGDHEQDFNAKQVLDAAERVKEILSDVKVPPRGPSEVSTRESVPSGLSEESAVTTVGSAAWFDRELDQYGFAADELASQERELRGKLDECRDGGDLLEDFQRYERQLRQVQARQKELAVGRAQYIADRDRLAEWGPTDEWVVAGSIVTVRYSDDHRETFVLTERHSDSEYETVAYSSPMGQAVRRRRTGDKVSLPAGAPLVIDNVAPGFRRPHSSRAATHPSAQPPASSPMPRQVPTLATAEEALAKQQCRDSAYRDDLYRRRYDPNVQRINQFVDQLRSQRRAAIPYVAPTYGGEDARLLTLMQDPGPKTNLTNADGSGMICLENVDLTAARQKYFLNQAGISVSEIVSWNAYPWPKPHPQTDKSDREAAEALRQFVQLSPHLEVVILNGTVAKRIWDLLEEISPNSARGVKPFRTFHTSERAVNPTQKSAAYIDGVHTDLSKKYAAAARFLRGV